MKTKGEWWSHGSEGWLILCVCFLVACRNSFNQWFFGVVVCSRLALFQETCLKSITKSKHTTSHHFPNLCWMKKNIQYLWNHPPTVALDPPQRCDVFLDQFWIPSNFIKAKITGELLGGKKIALLKINCSTGGHLGRMAFFGRIV